MRPPLPLLILFLVLWLAAGAAPATASLTTAETLYLDAYDFDKTDGAGPVQTSDVLEPGRQYIADVSGTYSALNADVWATHADRGLCGTPEPFAMIPSPLAPSTLVGQDAETRWAMPWQRFCPALPRHDGAFQMDADGKGFQHPITTGGELKQPTANHSYSYAFEGHGIPARFRIDDVTTRDNNGILTIIVRPADVSATPAPSGAAAGSGSSAGAGAVAQSPAVAAVSPTVTLPSNKTCLRSRKIRLSLTAKKGDVITGARVRVNGKTVRKVLRRHGHTSRVIAMSLKLSSKRTGKASVVVVARTRKGKTVVARKTYRLCA